MHEFLQSCRFYFGYAFFFSLFINLLQLTFPIYMLQVYDKVLTSYSMSTLVVITIAAVLCLVVLACLEWLRSRLLVRAGVEFDRKLSLPVLEKNLRAAASPIQKTQGTLRDVQTLRNFLGGNAVFAFFDAPWMPVYLIFIFILHPLLGVVAVFGCISSLTLGVLTDRFTRKKLHSATMLSNHAGGFVGTTLRNAGIVRSMGMVGAVSARWGKINHGVIDLQTRASRSAGLLQAISKSMRVGMQVLIYAVGAYLAVIHESTPGVMIAASIIMGRTLAPMDLAMGSYKLSLEARAAYKRLKEMLDVPPVKPPMPLPDPQGNLAVEGLYCTLMERPIIKGLSFQLAAGQSLAIIGPSAAANPPCAN
ncbi:MAG: hypothetical protein LBV76_04575 [Deltaproteobacteria bacterium]|jgi:ABC-type protease/lipase transport system fused ATPase/permease subunit|nr:hypothetical protein [Deltaproteobacteria bacterium]